MKLYVLYDRGRITENMQVVHVDSRVSQYIHVKDIKDLEQIQQLILNKPTNIFTFILEVNEDNRYEVPNETILNLIEHSRKTNLWDEMFVEEKTKKKRKKK